MSERKQYNVQNHVKPVIQLGLAVASKFVVETIKKLLPWLLSAGSVIICAIADTFSKKKD